MKLFANCLEIWFLARYAYTSIYFPIITSFLTDLVLCRPPSRIDIWDTVFLKIRYVIYLAVESSCSQVKICHVRNHDSVLNDILMWTFESSDVQTFWNTTIFTEMVNKRTWRRKKIFQDFINTLNLLNWFMHPVARVSINKYRNLRTQQMLVHSLVCIFSPEDGHQ
jgi:hypothetical protein